MSEDKKIFDRITTFRWAELEGKTLEIVVSRDSGFITVGGKDVKTGVLYVLHCKKEDN